MFPGSNFYGIKEEILAYARLPAFLPLPVAIQHGWQRVATSFEASKKPPEIWVWSERLARDQERLYPRSRIRIVGAPFCYMLEALKGELPAAQRLGSICIPPHSSHHAKVIYSHQRYIEILSQMEDKYKPIIVMLYYLDMDDYTVSLYEAAGFNVVSNGSLYDKDFLRKFVMNCHDKIYCIYSGLGSGVLYASELGMELVRISVEEKLVNMGNTHLTEETVSASADFDEFFFEDDE